MKLANILITDPRKGWVRFLIGLAIFMLGLGITLSDASNTPLLQWIGIGFLLLGFSIAMTGYVPMIWHRLTSAKRNASQFSNKR